MVANTWIAAAPGDWSDDANWSLGHSPIAGEDPTFDGTSVNNCAANDSTPTGVLTIAAGYSGTITQSSDMYISGYSQAGGTFTGVNTKWVYCSGDFVRTAGTLITSTCSLKMLGELKSINIGDTIGLGKLWVAGYTYWASGSFIGSNSAGYQILIDDNKTLYINSGKSVTLVYQNIGSTKSNMINNGTISGTGNINFRLYDTNYNFPISSLIGNINCTKITFLLEAGATGNYAFIMLDNYTFISDVYIQSAHATRIITLDLNGHSLTASSITVDTRGILQCGEGTITTGALDSSAGTITEETATWIFERGSTIKVAAAQKLYNVIAKGSSALKLLSNLGISELFAHPAEIDRNGFTLTLDQPDKEYAGLRRPIIVPVKKLDIGEVGLLDSWLRDLGGLL